MSNFQNPKKCTGTKYLYNYVPLLGPKLKLQIPLNEDGQSMAQQMAQ